MTLTLDTSVVPFPLNYVTYTRMTALLTLLMKVFLPTIASFAGFLNKNKDV